MADLGTLLLFTTLAVSLYVPIASFLGVRLRRTGFITSARRGVGIIFVSLTACIVVMMILLIRKDYTVYYVWKYTSLHLPAVYSAAALWAGNAGSLLLWVWLLSLYSVLAVNLGWNRNLPFMPVVMSVVSLITLFFMGLMLGLEHTNPFEKANPMMQLDPQGNGLNPQLENPFMVIHPPCLYLGYIGFTIPFAFAMAALVSGRLDSTWIRQTRLWTLTGWFFLTVGNILGGWWAYVTLGWGGYWAWDPVENAAFIPWLLGTAFLHSVIIQEVKGMLKIWNMILIIMTFIMTVFGTFLTRSGLLQSVHSFSQSDGFTWSFLGFLFVVFLLSMSLLIARIRDLKTEAYMESLLSRESAFLFNNVLLAAAAFTVLWGTMFPWLSQQFRDIKVSVGPPFFNQVLTPIWFLFILLMGIGPLISWRKATVSNFKRNLAGPLLAGVAGGLILAGFGVTQFWPLLFLSSCIFVTATIVLEFGRGTVVRSAMTRKPIPTAAIQLVSRQKRRYGGYIVHLGVVVLVVGIALSQNYEHEKELSLHLGESFQIERYTITYNGFERRLEEHKDVYLCTLTVQNGSETFPLKVEKDYYPKSSIIPSWSRATIFTTLQHDLYITLTNFDSSPYEAGGDPSQPPSIISLHARVLPGVVWIWIGGFVMAIGTSIAMWPSPAPKRVPAQVPSGAAAARV